MAGAPSTSLRTSGERVWAPTESWRGRRNDTGWNSGLGRAIDFRLDGTLRLSQVSDTFRDELLLPPTRFDVPCLLPKLHLSTGS